MHQRLILFIIILQYLLIECEGSTIFGGPIKLRFDYSTLKPLQAISRQVSTRLFLKNNTSNYYSLTIDAIDDKTLLVKNISCIEYNVNDKYCRRFFESIHLFLSHEEYPKDYVLLIESNSSPLIRILNDFIRRQQRNEKDVNLTIVFIDIDGGSITRPTDLYENPLSKTNLFGIIFLITCVVLVVALCVGWFSIIYCRRYRHYRMKKKLRQALAQSTQEMLDQSPVIIYDPTKRDQDQTDDEPICAICLEIFKSNEKLRKLVCAHYFHITCIDPWLLSHQSCPLCNRNILRNSIPSISSSIMAAINERNNDESTSIARNENNQTV